MPNDNPSPEDILRRLRESQANDVAGSARRTLKKDNAGAKNVREGILFLSGVARCAFAGGRAIRSVASHSVAPLKWCFNTYAKGWNKVVYAKDADGDLEFSKKRAAAAILGTALAVGSVPVALDAAFYAATEKDETVYLHMPEEPGGNHVYTVDGAYSYPASAEDAIHYEIKDSIFNDIWNIAHHGKKFFPDYVKAAVPPVPSRCEVHSYGFRAKVISRYGHIYPQLLDVSCEPLGMSGTEGQAIPKGGKQPAIKVTAEPTL